MARLAVPLVVLVGFASALGTVGVAGATTPANKVATPSHASARRHLQAAPKVPARAKKLSSLPAASLLRVDVLLKPSNSAGLADYAHDVSTPGSPAFHHYLTTAEFASNFGPSAPALSAVEAALRAEGLPAGRLSADHLSIRIRASVARLSKAFSTQIARYRLRSGRVAFANTNAPSLPAGAAIDVEGVVGLDNLTLDQAGAVHVKAPKTHGAGPLAISPQIETGGPQACAAVGTGASAGAYSADQIAADYGLSGLYGRGDLGQGQTVALIEGEPDLPSDIAAYQSCYSTHATVNYVPVDGGAGSGSGEGEAALDIEQIIGLAPAAHIVVYQTIPSITYLYDEFVEAISADAAKVVSTSWGVCEALVNTLPDATGGYASTFTALFQAENTLFEEAAIQGQSIVAASGDNGSEECNPQQSFDSAYSSELAVQDPSAQPYVTGVGGTTLADPAAPSSETVWNSVGASGGGISTVWPMPAYQSSAPGSLNVVNGDSSAGPCGAVGGYCREVPDVSANADPYTGYAIYWSGSWWSFGGTSAGAPLWSALLSLTNVSTACAASPVGFADPALYAAAATDPGAFNDITVGNNDYTRANGGLYPAGAGYDMATGLGTPTANLPAVLCARASPSPVQITSASSALFGLNAPGSFTVDVSGSPAPTIGQSGTLPGGVVFTDNQNGTATLSGTPTTSGFFPVVLTATNGTASSSQPFTLEVGSAPIITSASTAVFRTGVKGAFQMAASGTPRPTFSVLSGTLPTGLVLSSTGKLVGTPAAGTSGTYAVTVQAANGLAPPATQVLAVVVGGAPVFTSGSAASFAFGVRGTFVITTSAAPTAVLSESGTLVPGLVFTPEGGGRGVIAGTPTVAGLFSVTIRAANADGSTLQTLTMDAATHLQRVAFTSPASLRATVAVFAAFQFRATGQPAPTFSIVSGALPPQPGGPTGIQPALTLSRTGLLKGWPYWSTGGVYHFVVEADNGTSPPAFQDVTLTLVQPGGINPVTSDGVYFTISPTSTGGTEMAADLALGQPARVVIRTSGFPTPTVTETGTMPAGTTFTDDGDGTATISGTPTTGGTSYVFLSAANAVGGESMPIALSVAPAVAPSFVSAPSATVLAGGCVWVTATGFPVPKVTETGAAPFGWFVDILADGEPWDPMDAEVCDQGYAGTGHLTFTATNAAGQAAQTLTVSQGTTRQAPFGGPTSAVFEPGVYHAFFLGSTNECGYGYRPPAKLPQGLTMNDSGLVYGVASPGWGARDVLPVSCIAYAPTVYRASKDVTVTIPGTGSPPPFPTAPPTKPWPEVSPPANQEFGTLAVLNSALPIAVDHSRYSAQLQVAYEGQFSVNGIKPYTWSVIGRLPPGLKLNPGTGLLQGVARPSDRGTYTFTVHVQAKVVWGSGRHPATAIVTGSAVLSILVLSS